MFHAYLTIQKISIVHYIIIPYETVCLQFYLHSQAGITTNKYVILDIFFSYFYLEVINTVLSILSVWAANNALKMLFFSICFVFSNL